MISRHSSIWLLLAIAICSTGCDRAKPVGTDGPWNIEVTITIEGESDPVDADDDGYLSSSCGGEDCDDQNEFVNPGIIEGPGGSPYCADQLDNDCDGLSDSDDEGCAAGHGTCSPDGWCWEHPLPQGNDLEGIWAFSADDAWSVGEAGTILHWNGVVWKSQDSPADQDLRAVWGTAPDNVWAVGVTYHFDGDLWT